MSETMMQVAGATLMVGIVISGLIVAAFGVDTQRSRMVVMGGFLVISPIVLWNLGLSAGVAGVRRAAVEKGAAHWTVDPVTGELSFEWREAEDEPGDS